MSKLSAIFVPLSLIIGSLSAQAKEVELYCYTLKGHPHGLRFIIDLDNKSVRDATGPGILKPERDYQILSWSFDKIIFSSPPSPIRKVIGYHSFSINRVNLDFYAYHTNKNELLEYQLFGKCEMNHTQPQF